MTRPRPSVAVVVLNWNGKEDTLACLESLAATEPSPDTVIVVDNGSQDGSVAEIRRAYPEATVLETGTNLGYAGGNNVGIRHALDGGAEYVWVLNNDTVVDRGALSGLLARMRDATDVGLCGSTLLYHDGPGTVQAYGGGRYDPWTSRMTLVGNGREYGERIDPSTVEADLAFISGASVFVRRAFLESVGPMCEDYFLYYEELDWAWRGRPTFRLGFAPGSVVWHKEGASAGTHRDPRRRSELADCFGVRSRFLFARKFHRHTLPLLYLTLPVLALNRIVRGQWRRLPRLARAVAGDGRCRDAEVGE